MRRRWWKENLGYKALAFALACLLWVTLVGDEQLSTSVLVPVQYKNMPRPLEMSSELPGLVRLDISGPATSLRPGNLAGTAVLLDFAHIPRSGSYSLPLDARTVNLPAGVNLDRSVPAQLAVRFEPRLTRTVPIRIATAGAPPEDWAITEVRVNPATVTIVGPQEQVSRVQEAVTDPIDLSGLTRSTSVTVQVSVPQPLVRFESASRVAVLIRTKQK